jgi:hypothetical protein
VACLGRWVICGGAAGGVPGGDTVSKALVQACTWNACLLAASLAAKLGDHDARVELKGLAFANCSGMAAVFLTPQGG